MAWENLQEDLAEEFADQQTWAVRLGKRALYDSHLRDQSYAFQAKTYGKYTLRVMSEVTSPAKPLDLIRSWGLPRSELMSVAQTLRLAGRLALSAKERNAEYRRLKRLEQGAKARRWLGNLTTEQKREYKLAQQRALMRRRRESRGPGVVGRRSLAHLTEEQKRARKVQLARERRDARRRERPEKVRVRVEKSKHVRVAPTPEARRARRRDRDRERRARYREQKRAVLQGFSGIQEAARELGVSQHVAASLLGKFGVLPGTQRSRRSERNLAKPATRSQEWRERLSRSRRGLVTPQERESWAARRRAKKRYPSQEPALVSVENKRRYQARKTADPAWYEAKKTAERIRRNKARGLSEAAIAVLEADRERWKRAKVGK
jgi:hypothetical protein